MRARTLVLAPLLAAALLSLSACTPHTTEATEVGVKFNKITRSMEMCAPGATYFFTPIINPPESAILGLGKIMKTPEMNTRTNGNCRFICVLLIHNQEQVFE